MHPTVSLATCVVPAAEADRDGLLGVVPSALLRSQASLVELDTTSEGSELLVVSHRLPEVGALNREWIASAIAFRCMSGAWRRAAEKSWTETTEPSDDQRDFAEAQLEPSVQGIGPVLRVTVHSFNWERDPRWSRGSQEWLVLDGDHWRSVLSLVTHETVTIGPARDTSSSLSTRLRWRAAAGRGQRPAVEVTVTRMNFAEPMRGARRARQRACVREFRWNGQGFVANQGGCVE